MVCVMSPRLDIIPFMLEQIKMDNFLILVTKDNSLTTVTKTFSNESLMKSYIELKTNAGFTCHKFDYETSFTRESRIIPTTLIKE
jgi:hypothetical protein